MMRNYKTMAMSATLLSLLLLGAACSDGNSDNDNPPTATPSPSVTAPPPSSSGTDPDPATPDVEPSEPADAERHPGQGEYVGLQDSHSVEIKLEDSTVAFQISSDIMEKIESWESGTMVTFEYTTAILEVDGQQVEQYTIVSIDKQ